MIFAEDKDGTLGHHVGHCRRLNIVSLEFARIKLNPCEYWGIDVGAETFGLGCRLALFCDNHWLTATRQSHAFDEIAVDATANAKGKEVGLATVTADKVEALLLNIHIAVGDNDKRT